MSDPAEKPFRLLRYFTGASLAVILLGAALGGMAAALFMRSVLAQVESDEAASIVEYFTTELAHYDHPRSDWGVVPLTPEGRARALGDMANFGIVELTIIDRDGRAAETLLAEGTTADPIWPDGLASAVRGDVALRWEGAALGPRESRGVVETYVPIREDNRVVAVAKLRRDLSPVVANALRAVPSFVIVATLVGLAVFGALWFLVRRADRLLARQRATIEQARVELEERNRLLEEIRRKKDDFYAMCSHDLRSPLLSVHAASQLLLDDRRHPLSPDQQLFLQDNANAIAGLLEIVDNLLDLARADAPGDRLRTELLDVADLLRTVVATHRILPANRGVSIGESYPEHGAPLVGDRHKLIRVFHNLLGNALKHGGGRPVEVAAEAMRDGVRVTFRDQGPGIAPELLGSIFDRYVRGGSDGMGLGLAVVKDLVEAHGGKVGAASRPGEGAALTVELPLGPEGFGS